MLTVINLIKEPQVVILLFYYRDPTQAISDIDRVVDVVYDYIMENKNTLPNEETRLMFQTNAMDMIEKWLSTEGRDLCLL